MQLSLFYSDTWAHNNAGGPGGGMISADLSHRRILWILITSNQNHWQEKESVCLEMLNLCISLSVPAHWVTSETMSPRWCVSRWALCAPHMLELLSHILILIMWDKWLLRKMSFFGRFPYLLLTLINLHECHAVDGIHSVDADWQIQGHSLWQWWASLIAST